MLEILNQEQFSDKTRNVQLQFMPSFFVRNPDGDSYKFTDDQPVKQAQILMAYYS